MVERKPAISLNKNRKKGNKIALRFAKPSKLQVSLSIPYKKAVYSSFVLVIVTLLVVWVSQKYLPPEVPLFYGLPESEEQIASSISLIIPSFISLVIIIINTTLAYFVTDKFTQKSLVLASLAVSVFSTITTLQIIILVGSF